MTDYKCFDPGIANTETFDEMQRRGLNIFAEDLSYYRFSEIDLPQKQNYEKSANLPFDKKSIEFTDKAIKINFSDFEGFENNEMNKAQFYVQLNDTVYNGIYNQNKLNFIKNIDILSDGINTCKIYVCTYDTFFESNEFIIFKSDSEILVADCLQEDRSVLKNYAQNFDSLHLYIDDIDGVHPSDADIITLSNNKISSIRGWVNVSDVDNKECYLKLDNAFFKLNWVERNDVVEHFNDPNYCGFSGSFFIQNLMMGENKASIVVVDPTNSSYTEQSLSIKIDVITEYQTIEDLTNLSEGDPSEINLHLDEVVATSSTTIRGWAYIADNSSKYDIYLNIEGSLYRCNKTTGRDVINHFSLEGDPKIRFRLDLPLCVSENELDFLIVTQDKYYNYTWHNN